MTISGAGFTGAAVTLDRKSIPLFSQSDTTIAVQMPPHDNGYAIFAVAQPAGKSYARFLYVAPPLAEVPAGTITTVAGIGSYSGDYGSATAASIRAANGIAFDPKGTLYFAEMGNNRVIRIGADGIFEPFAGNGLNGPHPTTPAPALEVGTSFPHNIVFDSHGNLIIPDAAYYVWRVTPDGVAELIAGNGHLATSVSEGVPAKGTAIGYPNFVAVDGEDNVYFIDWNNARVRKIDKAGILTTVAGNGTFGFSGDGGPATNAQFDLRSQTSDGGGLAADHHGNLYLLDRDNRRIRRVNLSTGVIDTIAGPAVGGQSLNDLWALAAGPDDTVYFSNTSDIYKRTADGTVTRIQSGPRGFSEDGSALPSASLGKIYGLAVDPAGNLVYSDVDVYRVRKIDSATGKLSTIAGVGPATLGENGPANAAPIGLNLDIEFRNGQLLIADNDRIEAIGSDGRLVRIAGSGQFGPVANVPALAATMLAFSLFVSPDGSIDYASYNIGTFRVDAAGIVRRTAGAAAGCDFSGDGGNALAAGLCQSFDAIRDADGNLYIADANNNRVRRVDAKTGVMTTYAGSGPVNGLEHFGEGSTSGDGGAATSARINTPMGLTFDDRGNLLISENQQRVRRVDASGTISTFAVAGCTKLAWAFGKLFCVGGQVQAISRDGEISMLTAGPHGFGGDGGPAAAAGIEAQNLSNGLAVDAEGNLFFADGFNNRLRSIRYGAVLAPAGATIQASATGTTVRAAVFDSHGHPAEGVRVDFAAPQAGPSCSLSSPFAITDASGVATVSCMTNCVEGNYSVTARPMASSATGAVAMTNGRCPPRRRSARH